MSFNILVLHSDRSTGIHFAQSLQAAKKQGWGKDVTILGVCSHPIRMQLCKNDTTYIIGEDDIDDIHALVKWIERKIDASINLVYETKSARYMLAISSLRDHIPVFLPPHSLIEMFEDKYKTYAHLNNRGLPVPETYLVSSPEDVENAFRKITTSEVWVRNIYGQAGYGTFSSNSIEEVTTIIAKRNGWRHYTIAEKMPIGYKHSWRDQLSSSFFPGEMVTWIALYNQGELVASQVRKRLYWEHSDLTSSGVTGYSGANMTVSRKDVHDLSDRIVRSFDWKPHGALGIDYVADDKGDLKLTEIQASRFYTSTYPMALLGLNLPQLYIDVFRSTKIAIGRVNPCPEGYIYIQRFGSENVMVHRDRILSELKEGYKLSS